jgi:hypothetical protein
MSWGKTFKYLPFFLLVIRHNIGLDNSKEDKAYQFQRNEYANELGDILSPKGIVDRVNPFS